MAELGVAALDVVGELLTLVSTPVAVDIAGADPIGVGVTATAGRSATGGAVTPATPATPFRGFGKRTAELC